jgi:hypothetical protein
MASGIQNTQGASSAQDPTTGKEYSYKRLQASLLENS